MRVAALHIPVCKMDIAPQFLLLDEEGIEVNLGNSDLGSGDDQPFLPENPLLPTTNLILPPQKINTPTEDIKDFETDDKDEEAPAIVKPPVTKPNATKVPEKRNSKKQSP